MVVADVDITAGNLSISGGGLPDEYRASRLHFHWGSSDMAGSEHTLDNVAYPMELQIVHYQKSLGKLAKAIVQPDGLAVLGFFFEISATDNRALNTLIKYLQAIQHPGTSIGLPPFSLNSILPTNKANFFRYTGSLTVPGCFQSVIWTVFSDTIKISASQVTNGDCIEVTSVDSLADSTKTTGNFVWARYEKPPLKLAAFRLLKSSVRDEDGSILTMVDNYRPVQNLNQRVVTRNFIAPLEHRPSTDLLKILREYYRTYKSRTSEEDQ